jgi:glutamate synthase (NADPH/NADH) large chain
MIGTQMVDGGSDSQDLDRTLATLIHRYGFSLLEALEIVFPPVPSEVENLTPQMQAFYRHYRLAWGPFSQGPAAIVARYGDECAVSVDALGLRPLWFGETEKDYFFSSEKGVYHLDTLCGDPRPLSPGEKMGVVLGRPSGVQVLDYTALRRLPLGKPARAELSGWELAAGTGSPPRLRVSRTGRATEGSDIGCRAITRRSRTWLAASGGDDDRDWVEALGANGQSPCLGYDGPLAALSAKGRTSPTTSRTVAVDQPGDRP